ncbi:MAG: hypothetical protein GXO61_06190 [Epsilonproteobacteria bacterium]|nr:hypothetical protein [Campylobacterota bacterium]
MEDLKNLVICPRCGSLHKRIKLSSPKESARCWRCNKLLYRGYKGLEYQLLSFTFTALILFTLANLFPIVEIDIGGGVKSRMVLLEALLFLYKQGFLFISLFGLLVLEVFPLITILSLFLFSLFVVLGTHKEGAKKALIVAGRLSEWNMLDIFFISILVAMVKIYEYAYIDFGVAFWSMAFFVGIEIYLFRYIKLSQMWDLWEQKF